MGKHPRQRWEGDNGTKEVPVWYQPESGVPPSEEEEQQLADQERAIDDED